MLLPPGAQWRRAGPPDAPAVRTLTRAAYAKWVPVIGREPTPMVADYEHAVREHRIDLVERAGRLLALIEMVERPADLLIENIAVDPDLQGCGLGRVLLDHADGVAASLGRTAVRLYTNEKMTENIAFYSRRGFTIESREVVPVGTRVNMVRLRGNAG